MGSCVPCFPWSVPRFCSPWDVWPSLGHVTDRNLVRPLVHNWASCALFTEMGREGQSSAADRRKGPFFSLIHLEGTFSIVPQPAGAFYLIHTEAPCASRALHYIPCLLSQSSEWPNVRWENHFLEDGKVVAKPDSCRLSPKVLTHHPAIPQGTCD